MNTDSQDILANAFNALPKIVQASIKSANVPAKMKDLASKHKIHLDKWAQLENEMILTLFGITDPDELVDNIQKHVGLSREEAVAINNDAVEIIFEPIRKKLQTDAESRASDREGAVIPIDQQKIMVELGQSAPKDTGTEMQNSKTVFQIIKERAENKEAVKTPLPGNIAGDSQAERHEVAEDPYRELPV